MKKTIILLSVLTLSLFSCQKEDIQPVNPTPPIITNGDHSVTIKTNNIQGDYSIQISQDQFFYNDSTVDIQQLVLTPNSYIDVMGCGCPIYNIDTTFITHKISNIYGTVTSDAELDFYLKIDNEVLYDTTCYNCEIDFFYSLN